MKLKIPKVGSKGVRLGIPEFIFVLFTIGIVLVLYYFVYLRLFDIRLDVNDADVSRHAYTLANVILSSDKLIYNDGSQSYRDILDAKKLDDVKNNQQLLFDHLGYPASSTEVTIKDLDTGNEWIFSSKLLSSTINSQQDSQAVAVTLPAAIRVSENDLHTAQMTLKLTEYPLT